MKSNSIEDELDAIRAELYEETRGMSASEVTAYITKQLALPLEECDSSRNVVSL
jgi:hypothetical protein